MNALDISSITFSYDGMSVYALQNFSLSVDGRADASASGTQRRGKIDPDADYHRPVEGLFGRGVYLRRQNAESQGALVHRIRTTAHIALHDADRSGELTFLRRDGRTAGRTNCIAFGNCAGTDRPYGSRRRAGHDVIPAGCKGV